jgi:arsenate reductase
MIPVAFTYCEPEFTAAKPDSQTERFADMFDSIKALASIMLLSSVVAAAEPSGMFPAVQKYADSRVGEFDQIPAARKEQLQRLSDYIASEVRAGKPIRLTFICTHNSRRSHMSQIWASVAAEYYGIRGVESFSGGTEATAFNPRAIAVIDRAGLKVEATTEGKNPHYAVRFRDDKPLDCFSKAYSDAPNPKEGFCAVMTCSQADKACPVVLGCSQRVAIPFDDPKVSDSTPEEAATYDERCRQIAREILYAFSQVKK